MDTTIPAFLQDSNVDAVAWKEASDGDYILLRDPKGRAHYSVWQIDGVPTFDEDGVLHAFTRTVQFMGNQSNYPDAGGRRSFQSEVFQVWRDFGRATSGNGAVRPTNTSSVEILFMNEGWHFELTFPYRYDDGVLAGVVEYNKLGHAWVQRVGEERIRCPRLDTESPTIQRAIQWNIQSGDPSGEFEFLWARTS